MPMMIMIIMIMIMTIIIIIIIIIIVILLLLLLIIIIIIMIAGTRGPGFGREHAEETFRERGGDRALEFARRRPRSEARTRKAKRRRLVEDLLEAIPR